MKKLYQYRENLTEEQKNATDALNGYLLELACKDYAHKPLKISEPGKVDLSFMINGKLRRVEVKQNGGDFRSYCKGSSFIAYAVYIEPDKTLREQLGYIMPMKTFIECGEKLNHIRESKTDSRGNIKMSLQTLYVYSKNDFHGKKAFKLMDLWEEAGAIPFKDFFKD